MDVIQLVKKAKKGSKEALLQLIIAEKDVYYRLALTYMGNPHDAMDAMQKMIVTLYEKIDQLKIEEAFYSWSKTILVNSCKALLRQQIKLVLIDDWNTSNEIGHDYAVIRDPYISSDQRTDIQELLQHLNEQGTTFTINGIMNDANQFVMFYTLTNPTGLDDSSDLFRHSRITGFFTNSNVSSGVSILNEEHTEIKGTMTFEAVSPFSKKLTLHFWQQIQDGRMVEGNITFPYNPNKALATKIVQPIKKKIKVDKGTITFASITATPTSTVINGSLSVENFDRVNLALDGIELLANGAPIELIGSGSNNRYR